MSLNNQIARLRELHRQSAGGVVTLLPKEWMCLTQACEDIWKALLPVEQDLIAVGKIRELCKAVGALETDLPVQDQPENALCHVHHIRMYREFARYVRTYAAELESMPDTPGPVGRALCEATARVVDVANAVGGICTFHLEKIMDLD